MSCDIFLTNDALILANPALIIYSCDILYTEKNLTLKSNLFQRSESTMCVVIETITIRHDSIRKLSWIWIYIELISIFDLNQLQFSLIQLPTKHIFDSDLWKYWISEYIFFQCFLLRLHFSLKLTVWFPWN